MNSLASFLSWVRGFTLYTGVLIHGLTRTNRQTTVPTKTTPTNVTGRNVNDHNAILAHVLDNPEDDTFRLVLADLLRESNDPDRQALGRFIWGGVTAAQYDYNVPIVDPLYLNALAELATVTADDFQARWVAGLGLGPSPFAPGDWESESAHDRAMVNGGSYAGVFTRGMCPVLFSPFANPVTYGSWPAVSSWRNAGFPKRMPMKICGRFEKRTPIALRWCHLSGERVRTW